MKPSTYFLRTFGCQMNDHDAERIRAAMEDRGYRRVSRPEDADVLVYNTCTVRASADQRLAGHLGAAARIKRQDPRRVVVLTGCLPQAEQAAVFTRFPFVDIALGPQNLHRMLPAVEQAREGGLAKGGEPRGFFEDGPLLSGSLPARRERPFQAWVQVMSGCTNFCTYCIVPYVRGPERSRPADEILTELRALVADGVREVTFLGQNVNAYGRDLRGSQKSGTTRTFAGLLRMADAVGGLDRIRFLTSHPKDLGDEMIAAMAQAPAICEHLHLPVQSGSNAVLERMRRGYSAQTYLRLLDKVRAALPDAAITTDLIVGFPGETEAAFAATLELVEQAQFDAAFTFVYSPRRGTDAATMSDQIPEDIKHERVRRLIARTQAIGRERRGRFVGRRLEVLVEGASRDSDGLRGRTRHNVTVNFGGRAAPGQLVEVAITAATSTTLRGTV